MGRLTGERVVLREFREEDLSGMRSWMIDAESTRYLGGNTLMPPSWEMSETALRRLLSGDAGGYNWVIAEKDSLRYLGQVSLILIDHLNRRAELTLVMAPDQAGKGYAKEQLRLALPVAKALGISRALITCHDWNTASARTIEACGGVFEDKRQDGEEILCRYWIDIPLKTLETERLILRPWTMDDVDDLFAYAQNPKVGPAAGWKPHESREESEEIVKRWTTSTEVWAIEEKASGRVIGSIGLHNDGARSNPRTKMIGYVLREESWGRGYMPEAVRRMTRFAFEELCMDTLSIQHFEFNTQSRRVIEKCGYKFEGVLRRAASIFDGSVHDEWMWSMLRQEYFSARKADV